MTDKDFDAFKQAWNDYPSQDNEGYLPDRAGFKCGWFAALAWERSHSSYEEGIKTMIDWLQTKHTLGQDFAAEARQKFGVAE